MPGSPCTWNTISWNVADEDNLSAWSAGTPSRLTVPAGVTEARVRFHANWTTTSALGIRYLAASTGTFFGALGADVRQTQQDSEATLVTPWMPVTAGDYIYCSANPGAVSIYLQGGSFGSMFGGPTAVEVEWR